MENGMIFLLEGGLRAKFEEDRVLNQTGVKCRIRVDGAIRIAAKDYADYLLARSVIEEHNPQKLLIIREEE
jgi:hypothetical protein